MGSLILCHRKHALHPYDITRIHRKIYTIEELCLLSVQQPVSDRLYDHERAALCMAGGRTGNVQHLAEMLRDILRTKGSDREIRADHSVGFQYLQRDGDDPDPECTGTTEESEGYRTAEI